MKIVSSFLLTLFFGAAFLFGEVAPPEVERLLKRMDSSHPRLFLKAAGEKELVRSLAADPLRAKLRGVLLARADRVLEETPVERVLEGRRLLGQSRRALGRVLHLGLAWRLTGEAKYASRAKQEMLAAARFTDWNPSHFLDVAEMTTALGTGYDWFYAVLNEGERETIRTAIVEKGLKPSIQVDSWSKAKHNWNQVCNGGMVIGALAVAESEPELATRMITRAVNTVPLAMKEYDPDGAYPEGPSYWGYGTTYNVLLLSALESALGTDFGLAKAPGFLATADYLLHVFGPTGEPFAYSDAGTRPVGLVPAMFWFAAKRGAPYLLWPEWAKWESLGAEEQDRRGDRIDALLPVWLDPKQQKPSAPAALSWSGRGATPVAMHRTDWGRDAVYVGIKGGSPATNHAHMDVGTFVMDADGVRWADDLGMQDYNSLESKGVPLWSKGQDAGRWKVFRLGTSAHSVLMVNGQQQRYDSQAPLTLHKPGRTVVHLTGTYAGLLARSDRGIALRPDRTVVVQDEFAAPAGAAAAVRWAMVTRAEVTLDGPGVATLRRNGKTLRFEVVEPAATDLQIYSTDPPAATDAPNPGTRLLGFMVKLPAGEASRVVVRMIPESAKAAAFTPAGLARW
ncbi:MAG: heparinase II/III family protein [Bryobacterales bacterium]|nr:heparinase II/III family protein [Bryobacterales bacterium]